MAERTKRNLLVRRWRLFLALPVGLAVGLAADRLGGMLPGASALVGWIAACLAYLAPTLWMFVHAPESDVRRNACEEDENRFIISGLVLSAAAISFAAIVVALREAKGSHGGSPLLVLLSIGTIVCSWLVVQAIFTVHYAHKYFGDRDDDGRTDRGLTFQGDPPSNYMDFLYIAVCLGATFQVSDFNLTNTSFRNLVTAHALVAFGFNTLVLALGVNIVGNLMGQ